MGNETLNKHQLLHFHILTLSAPHLKVSSTFTFYILKLLENKEYNQSNVFVNLWEWAKYHQK